MAEAIVHKIARLPRLNRVKIASGISFGNDVLTRNITIPTAYQEKVMNNGSNIFMIVTSMSSVGSSGGHGASVSTSYNASTHVYTIKATRTSGSDGYIRTTVDVYIIYFE